MRPTKRRHSSSPSPVHAVTGEAPPSSYALSSMYPPDKLDLPSSPLSLLPSSMPLSSPQRFAYREPTCSDTESDSGASDDEIEASLASFPPKQTEVPFAGKGKAVDRGRALGNDIARERAHRRQATAKLQATLGLGRRPRGRVSDLCWWLCVGGPVIFVCHLCVWRASGARMAALLDTRGER